MASRPKPANVQVHEMTAEEERALIEREVRRYFDMTPEEFLCKWRAGEIENSTENHSDLVRVLMFMRLAG
ncbi:MAG TPA: hypothetical protein VIM74_06890 [Casimicrobiaceae bacterium]|jgi:hypothetical protein